MHRHVAGDYQYLLRRSHVFLANTTKDEALKVVTAFAKVHGEARGGATEGGDPDTGSPVGAAGPRAVRTTSWRWNHENIRTWLRLAWAHSCASLACRTNR